MLLGLFSTGPSHPEVSAEVCPSARGFSSCPVSLPAEPPHWACSTLRTAQRQHTHPGEAHSTSRVQPLVTTWLHSSERCWVGGRPRCVERQRSVPGSSRAMLSADSDIANGIKQGVRLACLPGEAQDSKLFRVYLSKAPSLPDSCQSFWYCSNPRGL